jgi:hypothetical protein
VEPACTAVPSVSLKSTGELCTVTMYVYTEIPAGGHLQSAGAAGCDRRAMRRGFDSFERKIFRKVQRFITYGMDG